MYLLIFGLVKQEFRSALISLEVYLDYPHRRALIWGGVVETNMGLSRDPHITPADCHWTLPLLRSPKDRLSLLKVV